MQQKDKDKNRWCIYIDILGFSNLWESERSRAIDSLGKLMCIIGSQCYPETPDRLFIHKTGDAFAIVSEFGKDSLDQPIAIASVLMRHIVNTGTLASATIAEGDFADISGYYPRNRQSYLTVSKVMGTAFIRAYKLSNEAPSGPFLILPIDTAHTNRIPVGNAEQRVIVGRKGKLVCSINWIQYESESVERIRKTTGILFSQPDSIRAGIRCYCNEYPHMGHKWRENLRHLLGIDGINTERPIRGTPSM